MNCRAPLSNYRGILIFCTKGEIEEETSTEAEEILVPEIDTSLNEEESLISEETKDIVIRKEYEKVNYHRP